MAVKIFIVQAHGVRHAKKVYTFEFRATKIGALFGTKKCEILKT
jgi:hypothetical protein